MGAGVPSGGSWLPMWYQGHSHAGRAWILGDPGRRPGARGPCSVACPLDFHPAASGACLIGPLGPLHPAWVTQVSVGLAAAATEPGRLCFSSTVSLSYLTLKTMSNDFPENARTASSCLPYRPSACAACSSSPAGLCCHHELYRHSSHLLQRSPQSEILNRLLQAALGRLHFLHAADGAS